MRGGQLGSGEADSNKDRPSNQDRTRQGPLSLLSLLLCEGLGRPGPSSCEPGQRLVVNHGKWQSSEQGALIAGGREDTRGMGWAPTAAAPDEGTEAPCC